MQIQSPALASLVSWPNPYTVKSSGWSRQSDVQYSMVLVTSMSTPRLPLRHRPPAPKRLSTYSASRMRSCW